MHGSTRYPETEKTQVNAPLMKQVEELRTAPMASVHEKYRALFSEELRSKHRSRLYAASPGAQAESEGGLSERARQRALPIARDGDLRRLPPHDRAAMLATAGIPDPAARRHDHPVNHLVAYGFLTVRKARRGIGADAEAGDDFLIRDLIACCEYPNGGDPPS